MLHYSLLWASWQKRSYMQTGTGASTRNLRDPCKAEGFPAPSLPGGKPHPVHRAYAAESHRVLEQKRAHLFLHTHLKICLLLPLHSREISWLVHSHKVCCPVTMQSPADTSFIKKTKGSFYLLVLYKVWGSKISSFEYGAKTFIYYRINASTVPMVMIQESNFGNFIRVTNLTITGRINAAFFSELKWTYGCWYKRRQ